MAPALDTNYTALASNGTNTSTTDTYVVNPAVASALSPALVAVIGVGLVIAVVLSLIIVTRIVKDYLVIKAHRKKKQAIRPLVLRSGSSKVELSPGPQGPKPLLLPAIAVVRSSRAKASLASKFLGRWGATHIPQVNKGDVECAPSPTLIGSDEEEKVKGALAPEWTPSQLYNIPASHSVLVTASAPIISILTTEVKPLGLAIIEDLPAPAVESSPEDVLSDDIAEAPSPVSRSAAYLSLVAADVNSPIDPVAVPAIVVHNCSRPPSAIVNATGADDCLRVPSAPWVSSVEEEFEEGLEDVE